jgi:hypothetical protein
MGAEEDDAAERKAYQEGYRAGQIAGAQWLLSRLQTRWSRWFGREVLSKGALGKVQREIERGDWPQRQEEEKAS